MPLNHIALSQFALFRSLDDAAMKQLLAHASTRRIQRGDAVFEQGDMAEFFFVLLEGRLKVSQVTAGGRQMIVRMVQPGDLFGIARALRREDYPGTARAVVESRMLSWPMSYWDSVMDNNPPLATRVMEMIGKRLDEAHTRLREISTLEVEPRIANTVLRLMDIAGRQAVEGVKIDFPISRQDIAEMAGTTLHTVSRTLSAWRGQGIVIGGRHSLIISDKNALEQIASPAR